MSIRRTVNQDFFKKWSPEMAYVLGFFAADGTMIENKRGGHYLGLEITDKTLLYRIRELLGSNNKIAARRRNLEWKIAYRLQIGSNAIFSDLLKLGISPRKSKIIELPNIPEDYLSDFVRGYFDGDGHVTIGRYWRKDREKWQWECSTRFCSGSKKFLHQLQKALKPYCHGGYIYDKNRGHELVFSRLDSFALFQFMYHNIPSEVFLRRKFVSFQKAFRKLGYLGP